MKLYTKLTALMILLITVTVYAQAPLFSVGKRAGSTGAERAHDIAVSSKGDVYLATEFAGTVDFGNGVVITSAGNADYALVKYDSSGNIKWARAGGSAGTASPDRGRAVDVDDQGNVYAAGEYFITAVFGNDTLTSMGNFDTFIIKYDSMGNRIWIKDIKDTSQSAPRGLVVDNNNNIIVIGYFGASTGTTLVLDGNTLTSYGQRDIFVAKYNSNGQFLWAKNFGGVNSSEEGRGIAVDDAGNIYITGTINGTANFDGIVLNGFLGTDAFFAKLDPNGNVLWAKHGGSNRGDDGAGITVDGSGNVYAAGKFDSAAVFGTFSVDRNAGLDAYVVKLSPSTGDFLWFKYGGGTGGDYATDIIYSKNNVYVLGYFPGTATFGDSTFTSAGSADMFVWQITPEGNNGYVKQSLGAGDDNPYAIRKDYGGNLYVGGAFDGTLTLDGFQLTSAGGDDMFYGRLGNNPVPVELTSFTAAADGRNIVLNWSTATELNNSGFEVQRSTDKISFETVSFISGNGTSTEKHNYSYVDKNLNNSIYYYRLRQLDFDGTSSYSNTVEVSLAVPSVYSLYQNYPNPFNPSTEVSFSIPVDAAVTISVFNAIGEKMDEFSKEYSAGTYRYNFNGSKLSSGIYFYSITASGKDGSSFTQSKKMILMK